jgi:hypothetical protein
MFLGEAALTAVYTINRVPSLTIHNQTPYERLYDSTPNYSLLRVFGCICFVTLPPHERTKLEPRSRLCCFLGYGITQKGYRCYDPITQQLRISRHVEFWEHKMFTSQMHFPHSSSAYSHVFTDPSIALFPGSSADNSSSLDEPSTAASDLPDLTMDPSAASHTPEPSHEPRRSDRVRAPPAYLHDYHCFSVLATLHEPYSYRAASVDPLW